MVVLVEAAQAAASSKRTVTRPPFLSMRSKWRGVYRRSLAARGPRSRSARSTAATPCRKDGKTVEVATETGQKVVGKVSTLTFVQGQPRLVVTLADGQVLSDVTLDKVSVIRA